MSVIASACTGFYGEIVAVGMLNHNPFLSPIVRLPRGSRRPLKPTPCLTENQVVTLLSLPDCSSHPGRRDYAMLCVLFGAGLRSSELLALTVGDFVINNDVKEYLAYKLILKNTKTSAHEEKVLPQWAGDAVHGYLMWANGHDSDRLFRLSRTGLYKVYSKYLKLAGIRIKCGVHSCRVSAVNVLINRGRSHHDIQKFGRWSTVQMVQRYERARFATREDPGLYLVYGGKADENRN